MTICTFAWRLPFVAILGLTVWAVGSEIDAQEATPNRQAQTIRPTGEIEKVRGDFEFTEGPAWDASTRTLYFTDIPPALIYQMKPDGEISVFREDSGHSNGLLATSDGRLLACEMDGQVVSHDLKTSDKKVLAKQYEGQRFNACNDLILDDRGGVYFTDPLFRAPEPLPQGLQAVYYVAPDATVSRVTEGLAAPNGVALSPDGKTLYVIPSMQAEMLAYDVGADGMLSGKRVFCTLKQPAGKSDTGGDGMVVDVQGNLYITTHLGIQIFDPSGNHRGTVTFPEQPANVTFGGPDRKTMYVTARTGLYRVEMPIAGLPPN